MGRSPARASCIEAITARSADVQRSRSACPAATVVVNAEETTAAAAIKPATIVDSAGFMVAQPPC